MCADHVPLRSNSFSTTAAKLRGMGDSMDEELERGGMALAHAPTPHAFAGGPSSIGYQHPQHRGGPNLALPVRELAGVADQHHAARQEQQRQQQQHQHRQPGQGWARKRGRGDEIDFVQVGVSAAHAVRRSESPDSEMSSSSGSGGSEGSINRGIKRMRIGQDTFDLQQQQRHHDQHQHLQHRQGQHPLSAFERFSSGPPPPTTAGTTEHNTTTTPMHHPRPLTLGRATSDAHNAPPPGSTDPSRMARSGSGGLLQLASAGGREPPLGHHRHPRSSSFDCVAFPPSAPQPPAQARYVRGIRVETNAPSDVDYSNVNHALRQLHMERRMMAAARVGGHGATAGAGAGGGAPGGGWAGGGGPSR